MLLKLILTIAVGMEGMVQTLIHPHFRLGMGRMLMEHDLWLLVRKDATSQTHLYHGLRRRFLLTFGLGEMRQQTRSMYFSDRRLLDRGQDDFI
jgi:hypothetical protein